MTVMDFTGVYGRENFYRGKSTDWVDCRELMGTAFYCSEEAEAVLKEKIAGLPVRGIHFIDSGNYHYMTKLWTDRIQEPFSLILMDHHTDTQPPVFPGMLSCGGWVKDILDQNPFIKSAVLLGMPEQGIGQIPGGCLEKVKALTEDQILYSEEWKKLKIEEEVYLSVDKDILSKKELDTNWDQGNLSLDRLLEVISFFLDSHKVIGADICGACPNDCLGDGSEIRKDDRINGALLGELCRRPRLFL